MNQNYVLIGEVIGFNFILIGFLFLYASRLYATKRIEEVKKTILSVEINSVMERWKNKVTIVPMVDGRIKVDFPDPVLGIDLFFYLSQEDGKVIISDHGEIVSKFNMNRTLNKSMMKRLSGMFGLVYNHGTKCLYLETTIDKLDEQMWTMFFAIILLEYAKY